MHDRCIQPTTMSALFESIKSFFYRFFGTAPERELYEPMTIDLQLFASLTESGDIFIPVKKTEEELIITETPTETPVETPVETIAEILNEVIAETQTEAYMGATVSSPIASNASIVTSAIVLDDGEMYLHNGGNFIVPARSLYPSLTINCNPDPLSLSDIEETHNLFINAKFKPFIETARDYYMHKKLYRPSLEEIEDTHRRFMAFGKTDKIEPPTAPINNAVINPYQNSSEISLD